MTLLSDKLIGINRYFLSLTKDCNLRCIYCSQGQTKNPYSEQNPDPKTIASYFPITGNYTVCFFGGEPLLNWDYFLKIATAIKNRNPEVQLSVVTNGTLLTVERVKILNELDFSVGVSHDAYHFERTRGVPDFLKKNPEPYLTLPKQKRCFAATFNNMYSDFYEDFWNYFDEFVIKNGLKERENAFLQCIKDVENNTPEPFLIYNNPRWEKMLDKTFANLKKNILNDNYDCHEWYQYKLPIYRLNDRLLGNRLVGCGCEADTHTCHIDIHGRLFPCHNSSLENSNGHVNTTGLQPGNYNPPLQTEKCRNCEVVIMCGGGCPISHPDKHKYICYIWYQQHTRLLKMFKELGNEGWLLKNEDNIQQLSIIT